MPAPLLLALLAAARGFEGFQEGRSARASLAEKMRKQQMDEEELGLKRQDVESKKNEQTMKELMSLGAPAADIRYGRNLDMNLTDETVRGMPEFAKPISEFRAFQDRMKQRQSEKQDVVYNPDTGKWEMPPTGGRIKMASRKRADLSNVTYNQLGTMRKSLEMKEGMRTPAEDQELQDIIEKMRGMVPDSGPVAKPPPEPPERTWGQRASEFFSPRKKVKATGGLPGLK